MTATSGRWASGWHPLTVLATELVLVLAVSVLVLGALAAVRLPISHPGPDAADALSVQLGERLRRPVGPCAVRQLRIPRGC